jgi:hypothetical protein
MCTHITTSIVKLTPQLQVPDHFLTFLEIVNMLLSRFKICQDSNFGNCWVIPPLAFDLPSQQADAFHMHQRLDFTIRVSSGPSQKIAGTAFLEFFVLIYNLYNENLISVLTKSN